MATVLLAWLGCVDGTGTTEDSLQAFLRFAAVFPDGASSQASSIDEWRIEVVRPSEGVIAQDGGPVGPTQETVDVSVSVTLQSECESLLIRIELLGAGEVLFRAEEQHQVCSGGDTRIQDLTMEWVGPPPPVITPEQLSFTVQEGEAQDRTFTIVHSGGGVVNWSVRIEEGALPWLSIEPSSGSVSAGQPQTVTVGVDAGELTVGQHFANLTVEGEGFVIPLKRILVDVMVMEGPTLAVSPSALAFTADQGTNPPEQSFTVTNTGGGTLAWSASDDASWLALSSTSGSLGPGQSQTVTVTVTGASLSPGQYSGAITVTDPNAGNSPQTVAVSVTIEALPEPDLFVSDLTHSPADPTTDDVVRLAATVRNQGGVSAGPSVLSIVLGGTSRNFDVGSLEPGEARQVEWVLEQLPGGNYSVLATADATGAVAESIENNNQRTDNFTVTVAPRPDLVVSSLTHSPAGPTTDDPVTITAVVRNDGSVSAVASVLSLTLAGETTNHNVPSLAPAETYQVQRSEGSLIAGNYTVTAIADVTQTVEESDETDNQRTHSFTVTSTSQPDLVVINLQHAPANPTTQDVVTATVVLQNLGGAAAGASVLRIRLDNERISPTYEVPGLKPGQTHQVLRALGTLSAGGHTLVATADVTQTVDEDNEENNQRATEFSVGRLATSTTITSDNPDPSNLGETVTVTYTVAANAGTPTGTVTVTDGIDSCSGSVAQGSCQLALQTEGSRTLTATYGGDSDFLSSSDTEPHTVNDVALPPRIAGVYYCASPNRFRFDVEMADVPGGTIILRIGADNLGFTAPVERIEINFDGTSGNIVSGPSVATYGSPSNDRWQDGGITDWSLTNLGGGEWRFEGSVDTGADPFTPDDNVRHTVIRATGFPDHGVQNSGISDCGPTISNISYVIDQINSSVCDYMSPPGSLFSVYFNYSDATGDVGPGGDSIVAVAYQFSGGSSGVFYQPPEPGLSLTGNGYTGQVRSMQCHRFGNSPSVTLKHTLRDGDGNWSNPLSITIPKPSGANAPPPDDSLPARGPVEAVAGGAGKGTGGGERQERRNDSQPGIVRRR